MRLKLLLIFLLWPFLLMAQQQVSGNISDEKGMPLHGVMVVQKSPEGKIIGYSSSKADGSFSISVASGNLLEFSLLGYEKASVKVVDKMLPLKIRLKTSEVVLKEVQVKGDKLRIKGDTINYTLGAYAEKYDRTLGDVLARIPGFTVDEKSGQISYEGRAISTFYINGVNMLGGKYGVATNSLPQGEVGTVQVMKNHQPIKVLEDFSFSNATSINIQMKEQAKSHWVNSFDVAGGISSSSGLWKANSFALRLRDKQQTMFTYKTNNIGESSGEELFSLIPGFDLDFQKEAKYIQLSPISTPSIARERSLFNRTHAFSTNYLKKLSENAQWNFQLTYDFNRTVSEGRNRQDIAMLERWKTIDNRQDYKEKKHHLSGLFKYEKNSYKMYLKNELSTDLTWNRQWMVQTGTNPLQQYANVPVYEVKNDLYYIHRFGDDLITFGSIAKMKHLPQNLTADSLFQKVDYRQYSADNYIKFSLLFGDVVLSTKAGVEGSLHRLESHLTGISDRFGTTSDKSDFRELQFYVDPEFEYTVNGFNLNFTPSFQYLTEKANFDKLHRQPLFSPSFSLDWKPIGRLGISLNGGISAETLDATRFHRSVILQDYLYMQQGYAGYRHSTNKDIDLMINYGDEMKEFHTNISVMRNYAKNPYTATRTFVEDMIVLSAREMETTERSWQIYYRISKGIKLWKGLLSMDATYAYRNAFLLEDEILTPYRSRMITLQPKIRFSFWKNMYLKYSLSYRENRLDLQDLQEVSTFHNWSHKASIEFPIGIFSFKTIGEYYRNEIVEGQFKNFFLADCTLACHIKKTEINLSLRNLFNQRQYSYTLNSDRMISHTESEIRGRELLLGAKFSL